MGTVIGRRQAVAGVGDNKCTRTGLGEGEAGYP